LKDGVKMNLNEVITKTKLDYNTTERSNEEAKVIEIYGQMFSPNNIDNLTKEDFKSFLLLKNNKHWNGIHRQGNIITENMPKLREALKILLDESRPLNERLDYLFPKNKSNYIKGLGRAIVTPILMVVYPTKYGVYNTRSSEGLRKVNLKPTFNRGASFSEKYILINNVLNKLAVENEISLFALDEVWWKITEEEKPIEQDEAEAEELYTGFGLESHLRRFLVDNWEKTTLGKKYEILSEDGEIIGEEFNTKEAGSIDILAQDKKSNEWVVIELKKGRTSDAVVGQTLRYMGWIEENKIEDGEGVKGIIIVKEVDTKLKYSLSALKNKIKISCFEYNVQFKLDKIDV